LGLALNGYVIDAAHMVARGQVIYFKLLSIFLGSKSSIVKWLSCRIGVKPVEKACHVIVLGLLESWSIDLLGSKGLKPSMR
jgi:hypothetical protein